MYRWGRVLLWSLTALFIALCAAGLWFYLYLAQADRLEMTVQRVLTSTLGQAVSVDRIEITREGTLLLHDVIVGSTPDQPDGGFPLLVIPQIEARLDWGRTLRRGTPVMHFHCHQPTAYLSHDQQGHWNLSLPGIQSASDHSENNLPGPESSSQVELEFSATMEGLVVHLDNQPDGRWQLDFDDQTTLKMQSYRGGRIITKITGSTTLAGRPSQGHTPLGQLLIATANPNNARVSLSVEIEAHQGQWFIRADEKPAMIYEKQEMLLLVEDFLVSGHQLPDRRWKIDAVAFEKALVENESWENQLIDSMQIPWTSPPEGPLRFFSENFLYKNNNYHLDLAGIQINSATLASHDLPWLEFFSRHPGWKLDDFLMEVHLAYYPEQHRLDWSDGWVLFQGNPETALGTAGYFQSGATTEWKTAVVFDHFPIPGEDNQFSPGFLDAEMTWGVPHSASESDNFEGEGQLTLNQGQIGALRMLGPAKQLSRIPALAESRFDKFGFHFELKDRCLLVHDLLLSATLGIVSGSGSFGPNQQINLRLEVQPTQELFALLRDSLSNPKDLGTPDDQIMEATSSTSLATQPDDGNQPSGDFFLTITGTLDQPQYRFQPGENFAIPLDQFPINLF